MRIHIKDLLAGPCILDGKVISGQGEPLLSHLESNLGSMHCECGDGADSLAEWGQRRRRLVLCVVPIEETHSEELQPIVEVCEGWWMECEADEKE